MVADPEVVRDRESRIRRYAGDLREMAGISEAAFLQNRERQYAVLHALQLAIEASVEIATHICAADDLGIPSSYAEAFDLIEKAGTSSVSSQRTSGGWRDSGTGSFTSTGRSIWDWSTVSFRIVSPTSTDTWLQSSSTSVEAKGGCLQSQRGVPVGADRPHEDPHAASVPASLLQELV